MSALSHFPAKENKAHGGGVQNYPQSHEPAPPSTAVSNSGVFSHWCFVKTLCRHCLKITLLTPPNWRTREKKRTRTEVHNTEKKVLVLQKTLFRMILATWNSYILLLLHPPHRLCSGDHFCKAFDPWEVLWDVFQRLMLDKIPSSSCGYSQFEPTWGCSGAFSLLLCFQCHKYLIAVVNN